MKSSATKMPRFPSLRTVLAKVYRGELVDAYARIGELELALAEAAGLLNAWSNSDAEIADGDDQVVVDSLLGRIAVLAGKPK